MDFKDFVIFVVIDIVTLVPLILFLRWLWKRHKKQNNTSDLTNMMATSFLHITRMSTEEMMSIINSILRDVYDNKYSYYIDPDESRNSIYLQNIFDHYKAVVFVEYANDKAIRNLSYLFNQKGLQIVTEENLFIITLASFLADKIDVEEWNNPKLPILFDDDKRLFTYDSFERKPFMTDFGIIYFKLLLNAVTCCEKNYVSNFTKINKSYILSSLSESIVHKQEISG